MVTPNIDGLIPAQIDKKSVPFVYMHYHLYSLFQVHISFLLHTETLTLVFSVNTLLGIP